MKNCPNCGTPMMKGWCPRCHPNPQQATAYTTYMVGKLIMYLVILVVVLVIIFKGC